MNLQGKAGPVAVVIALVFVVGLVFFLYKGTVAARPHNVSPDNIPDYARQQGGTPYGQGGNTGAGGPPSYAPGTR